TVPKPQSTCHRPRLRSVFAHFSPVAVQNQDQKERKRRLRARRARGIDTRSALTYHPRGPLMPEFNLGIERSLTGLRHLLEPRSNAESTTALAERLRVALFYDLDACHGPTGVTRHALAQLERLANRPEVQLSVITGRMSHPDGRAFWETLAEEKRRELALST